MVALEGLNTLAVRFKTGLSTKNGAALVVVCDAAAGNGVLVVATNGVAFVAIGAD